MSVSTPNNGTEVTQVTQLFGTAGLEAAKGEPTAEKTVASGVSGVGKTTINPPLSLKEKQLIARNMIGYYQHQIDLQSTFLTGWEFFKLKWNWQSAAVGYFAGVAVSVTIKLVASFF